MAEFKLISEIIALSEANNWDDAKDEWKLLHIYRAEDPETCLCGHYPIVEICIIRNGLNGSEAIVGNCCVKKFLGLPSQKIFAAINRISSDKTKALNAEAIEHAYEKGWINNWEYNFSRETSRKHKLSSKQIQTRIKINEKVLRNMSRRKS